MIDTVQPLSPGWEKAKVLSAILATAIIPIVIGLGGNWYAKIQRDKEIQLKYIELSIQILSAEPSPSNRAVRRWAVDTINRYSDVKIDSEAENQLLNEQLRRTIDSYNQSAKEIIQSMGKYQ